MTVTWTSGYNINEAVPFVEWGANGHLQKRSPAGTITFSRNSMCGKNISLYSTSLLLILLCLVVCESSLVLIILLNAICCLLSLVVIYLFIYIFDFHQHSVGLVLCQYLTFARSTQLALVRMYPITSLFFIGFHSLMILEHHKLR